MEFSNKAAIATLKVINQRMDYLSNEVIDRSYDELMELNELGEMRQQLERETFIDYYVKGKLETDSVDNIKLNAQRRVNSFSSIVWADPEAAKMFQRSTFTQIMQSGLVNRDDAWNYATVITESNYVQYANGEAA